MPSEEWNSQNLSLCQECGGRCCQGSPGVWLYPERFFAIFSSGRRLTVEQLRTRLPELGLVLWEKTGVPIPAPRSLTEGCVFLGPDGCRLSVAERPCQCLELIPVRATLDQQQGCLCHLPEAFSREAGRQFWQNYWQSVNHEAAVSRIVLLG
jgi:Fe-S-cluster containining protein